MPAVKYLDTPSERIKRAVKASRAVSQLFRGQCETGKGFAGVLGKSAPTAGKRLEKPQELTLEELITASVRLGFNGSLSLHNSETGVEIHW